MNPNMLRYRQILRACLVGLDNFDEWHMVRNLISRMDTLALEGRI